VPSCAKSRSFTVFMQAEIRPRASPHRCVLSCSGTQTWVVTLSNEDRFHHRKFKFIPFRHAPWQERRMNSELRSFKRAWSLQCQNSTHAKTRAIVRKPRSARETVSYVPGFWARLRRPNPETGPVTRRPPRRKNSGIAQKKMRPGATKLCHAREC